MKRIRELVPWVGIALVGFMLLAHSLQWDWIRVDTTTLLLVAALLLVPFLEQVRRIKVGDVEAEIGSEEVAKVVRAAEKELGPVEQEVHPLGKGEPMILRLTREDPQLGLAKLRIEIEQALKSLVRVTGVPPLTRGFASPTKMAGALQLHGVLPDELVGALDDILPLANRAIHGEYVRLEDAKELAELGVRVLDELRDLYDDKVTEVKETIPLDPADLDDWLDAKYRVETVVPVLDQPYRCVRELTQEGLTSFLEGYEEYAEFIVRVERVG